MEEVAATSPLGLAPNRALGFLGDSRRRLQLRGWRTKLLRAPGAPRRRRPLSLRSLRSCVSSSPRLGSLKDKIIIG
uniref:Uncharacterized protein n=1 Tax=Arundo donax TaxID=35708 RepID=A0A0A9CPP9_ARUDO